MYILHCEHILGKVKLTLTFYVFMLRMHHVYSEGASN